MPKYAFIDTDTGEEFEQWMNISELDGYLAEHDRVKQQVCCPPTISGRAMKPDNGFRDLLRDVKKKHSKGISRSTINTF